MDVRDLIRTDGGERSERIVATLVDAFESLMHADPVAFRSKFRKMAADPFAFYRGSACLFYADVDRLEDPWVDGHAARVWIQGDLHAENVDTYMDSDGRWAGCIGQDVDGLVRDMTVFAHSYAERAREDHRLFVEAFRSGALHNVAPL